MGFTYPQDGSIKFQLHHSEELEKAVIDLKKDVARF